jgi:ABC-type multidrug transport system permease subunit
VKVSGALEKPLDFVNLMTWTVGQIISRLAVWILIALFFFFFFFFFLCVVSASRRLTEGVGERATIFTKLFFFLFKGQLIFDNYHLTII